MSPPEITVYFDYVCPYCLLAEDIITITAADAGATVSWRAFELRPHPNPTLRPEDDYLPRVWRQSVYPMAERLGVPIKLPTISPQPYSHLAFEGAHFAREHGVVEAYHGAVLRAFFQQDLDIGQPEVLTGIADEVGLDTAEFALALKERRFAEVHQVELGKSYAAGVQAVPTIDVGPKRFSGVPDPQDLRAAIAALS
ncbi:DsbA family oxidoreductase [Actinokineospora inagensis]|uniref:DsbA family oxidoreductase n=1 Tax=Actinokineospora inagensis TaxID=103730 RepID=UPI000550DBFE|nr:DsbA family protein [Actinokineospora inagensis]